MVKYCHNFQIVASFCHPTMVRTYMDYWTCVIRFDNYAAGFIERVAA